MLLNDEESVEGRLTIPSERSGEGCYSLKDKNINNISIYQLIDYIGILEDYIGDEHLNVWKDLNLKCRVFE